MLLGILIGFPLGILTFVYRMKHARFLFGYWVGFTLYVAIRHMVD